MAVARALNSLMTSLLLAVLFGFSVWVAYREVWLMIPAHGAKPGERLAHLVVALQPIGLFLYLAVSWRRKVRPARPEQ
jgi:uncharacterized membrane protein (DUF485 family)